jgi:hypothetical protein
MAGAQTVLQQLMVVLAVAAQPVERDQLILHQLAAQVHPVSVVLLAFMVVPAARDTSAVAVAAMVVVAAVRRISAHHLRRELCTRKVIILQAMA